MLPRGSISRWLNDDNMIYFTVAFGYEPGGLNIGEFGLLPFQAEKATSYELGWKGRWMDGRANASFAGFYIDYNKRHARRPSKLGAPVECSMARATTHPSVLRLCTQVKSRLGPNRELAVAAR